MNFNLIARTMWTLSFILASLPDAKKLKFQGRRRSPYRLLKGIPVLVGEFKFIARIGYPNRTEGGEPDFTCGASIISKWFLLSAAHCKSVQIVRVGETHGHDKGDETTCFRDIDNKIDCERHHKDYGVAECYPHEKYMKKTKDGPPSHNDIMLIKTNESMGPSFGKYVAAITLPLMDPASETYEDLGSMGVVVIGWGVTGYQTNKNTGGIFFHNSTLNITYTLDKKFNKLKRLNQRIVRIPSCRKTWNDLERSVARKMKRAPIEYDIRVIRELCAGGSGDSCRGDSGGPLITRFTYGKREEWKIIGITSWGSFYCGRKGIPAIYTKVAAFLPWITETMVKHQPES